MARRTHSTLWRTHNFLRRPDLVDQLLDRSRIGRHDVVYEIGAGTGVVTDRLAARCHRVLAIEKDRSLCETLLRRFADRPNVDVRCADFLEHPLPRARYKVFANPPFNITTAIVSRLVSAAVPPEDAFLAVQREAADRYLGHPSERLYALLLKPWFAPSIVHRFRRSDFTPAPGVDVVMLRLRKRGPPLVAAEHAQLYRDFVVACFTAWQPSVGAALARAIGVRPADAVMRAAHVQPRARPRDVPFRAWLRLFRAVVGSRGNPIRRVAGAEARLRRQQGRLRRRHRTRVTGPPKHHVASAAPRLSSAADRPRDARRARLGAARTIRALP